MSAEGPATTLTVLHLPQLREKLGSVPKRTTIRVKNLLIVNNLSAILPCRPAAEFCVRQRILQGNLTGEFGRKAKPDCCNIGQPSDN
jgi:hypothetical protein